MALHKGSELLWEWAELRLNVGRRRTEQPHGTMQPGLCVAATPTILFACCLPSGFTLFLPAQSALHHCQDFFLRLVGGYRKFVRPDEEVTPAALALGLDRSMGGSLSGTTGCKSGGNGGKSSSKGSAAEEENPRCVPILNSGDACCTAVLISGLRTSLVTLLACSA